MTKHKHEQTHKETSTEAKEEAKPTELDICKKEIEDLTNTLKRLQAEFENYKKRVEKENSQLIKNSNANLIKNLLPVLDSFEMAIKNSNGNPEIDKFRQGLEMIYAQLFSILKEQGLRPIEAKKFDPYYHEVMMMKETDADEGTILQEFQKGYMLNEVVLRHSKVMICSKSTK